MKPPQKQSLTRSALSAYLCICVALVLLLTLSVWGAYRDVRYLRTTLLQAEISRLRSHAERTVGRIERDLEQSENSVGLADLDQQAWLERYWANVIVHEDERLYATLVDADNAVVLHTDPELAGQQLERRWYERVVPEAGEDVVHTESEVLTGGAPAYSIRTPILLDNREVGGYYVGFSKAWFDRLVGEKSKLFLRQRGFVIGGILLIVLLATTSLFHIATHAVGLRKAISQSQLDRATEVAQLAAGLAHEIRNPMHAIRINLHALAKVDEERRLKLSPEEHKKLLEESNREIQRVGKLMQELVGFASPDEPRDEIIDLKSEVQSTIDFINREMLRNQVKIYTDFPPRAALVRFDPGRLRQLLLNIIQNAEQAFDGPGRVDVSIRQTSERIVLSISDDGPGISEEDRERIFEPFYSTKADGSGLGLAIVHRFVTEAGGEIVCERHAPKGTRFCITLPRATRTKQRT